MISRSFRFHSFLAMALLGAGGLPPIVISEGNGSGPLVPPPPAEPTLPRFNAKAENELEPSLEAQSGPSVPSYRVGYADAGEQGLIALRQHREIQIHRAMPMKKAKRKAQRRARRENRR